MSIETSMDERRWVRACAVGEIPAGGGRQVTIDGVEIAVFRTSAGKIFAVVDRCPHKGGVLSEGIVAGERVVCPMHGWQIELQSGSAVAPDKGCVSKFPVDVRGEHVYLDVTPSDSSVVPEGALTSRRPIVCDHEAPLLEVTRASERVVALSADDLRARYAVRDVPTYVTTMMFGFSRPVQWSGVRLCDVLEDVGGDALGATVTLHAGGTERALSRRHAIDPRTMLVFEMNGAPLAPEHGGPLRLVAPFLAGHESVKRLARIELCGAAISEPVLSAPVARKESA
ncbi:nitrite reductase small subunit NirD [Sandaracinus amylolyticus]|uniref:Nitrite reductase [NAD(P)H] small subunit n=1 Tax=Sandaracinus amylolyticus TaxID=927083 RepID=A0A0F6W7E2_9BACT|nr:nitrite reductase small subunit NirD [Sandaracinus amylolyticus]AKF09406.1 Nitrite reductase [NAD(P)H] small subunit [Sandaracinus amylolyticus]